MKNIFTSILQKCAAFYHKLFPNKRKAAFVREWTAVLATDANVYNGLFAAVRRIADGEAKKPGKPIREWCARTGYRWEGERIDKLCTQTMVQAAEADEAIECQKWARLLLEAAHSAGITTETEARITLDERSANAYVEWGGEELYVGDTVDVIHPAWYQNGRILEQGNCALVKE